MTASAQKGVAGCYMSNFAQGGFFVTWVHLSQDSTFKFKHSGDLYFDSGSGKYHLVKDTIFLTFNNDSALAVRPQKFLFRQNKLFVFNEAGRIRKFSPGYSACKRYLLFGHHYARDRKYFLKKLPCNLLND